MKLYYIQNKGYVGNCLLWWREGGHGYTCNLDEAWRVDEAKAREITAVRRGEDVAWPVEEAEAMAQRHVHGPKPTPPGWKRGRKEAA